MSNTRTVLISSSEMRRPRIPITFGERGLELVNCLVEVLEEAFGQSIADESFAMSRGGGNHASRTGDEAVPYDGCLWQLKRRVLRDLAKVAAPATDGEKRPKGEALWAFSQPVEARGIEPRSEKRSTTATTCVVRCWMSPIAG